MVIGTTATTAMAAPKKPSGTPARPPPALPGRRDAEDEGWHGRDEAAHAAEGEQQRGEQGDDDRQAVLGEQVAEDRRRVDQQVAGLGQRCRTRRRERLGGGQGLARELRVQHDPRQSSSPARSPPMRQRRPAGRRPGSRRPRARRPSAPGRPAAGSPRRPPSRAATASAGATARRWPGRARPGSRSMLSSAAWTAGARAKAAITTAVVPRRRSNVAGQPQSGICEAKGEGLDATEELRGGDQRLSQSTGRATKDQLLGQVRAGEAADRRVAPTHVPCRLRPLGQPPGPRRAGAPPPTSWRTATNSAAAISQGSVWSAQSASNRAWARSASVSSRRRNPGRPGRFIDVGARGSRRVGRPWFQAVEQGRGGVEHRALRCWVGQVRPLVAACSRRC